MSLTEQLFEETNPAESEPESQTAEEIDGIDLLLKRLTAMESNKPGAGPVYEPWHMRRVVPGAEERHLVVL